RRPLAAVRATWRGPSPSWRRHAGGRLVQLQSIGVETSARRHCERTPRCAQGRGARRDARTRRLQRRPAPGCWPRRRGCRPRCVVCRRRPPRARAWRGRDCRGDGSSHRHVFRSECRGRTRHRRGYPKRRCRARERFARHTDGRHRGSNCGGVRLMLLYLLYPLHTYATIFNVTRYITFRTAAASLTALALSLALGPWMIRKLRDFQIGQVIRQEGPQSHRAKAGTPTMGGLLILTSALVPTLLWANLSN